MKWNRILIACASVLGAAITAQAQAAVTVCNKMNFVVYVAHTFTNDNDHVDRDNAARGWIQVKPGACTDIAIDGTRQDFYARDASNQWRWPGTDFRDCVSASLQPFAIEWPQDVDLNATSCPPGSIEVSTSTKYNDQIWTLNEANAAFDKVREIENKKQEIEQGRAQIRSLKQQIADLNSELQHCDFAYLEEAASADLGAIDPTKLESMVACSRELEDAGKEAKEAKGKLGDRIQAEQKFLEQIRDTTANALLQTGVSPNDPTLIHDFGLRPYIPPEVFAFDKDDQFYSYVANHKYIPELFSVALTRGDRIGFIFDSWHWAASYDSFANGWNPEATKTERQLDWLQAVSDTRTYFNAPENQFATDAFGFREDLNLPEEFRQGIAESIGGPYPAISQKIIDAVNTWKADGISEQLIQQRLQYVNVGYVLIQFFKQLTTLSEEARRLHEERLQAIADDYAEKLKLLGRTAISVTPAGDALDLCEVVTGLENCLPGSRLLSQTERWFAAGGIFLGNRLIWSNASEQFGQLTKVFNQAEIANLQDIATKIDTGWFDLRKSLASEEVQNAYLKIARHKKSAEVTADLRKIKAIKENHAEFARLTDTEILAIRGYSEDDFDDINKAMRASDNLFDLKLKPHLAQIETISSGLTKLPPFKGKVSRSVPNAEPWLKSYEPNSIVIEKAFTSTSQGDIAFKSTDKIKFSIESKSGKNIEKVSKFDEDRTPDELSLLEREVLFPPGTKFFITERRTLPNGEIHIMMEEVD